MRLHVRFLKHAKSAALILAAAVTMLAAAPRAHAEVAVSISYFYSDLEPYGRWIDEPSYGECWVPSVSSGWRPYTEGNWVYTDYGWTWASSEPYGWAVYHYGRWVWDPNWGWVWVPGTEWAPAWVAWRWSDEDDCVGWAPLPPRAEWASWSGVAYWGDIPSRSWCFTRPRYLVSGSVASHLFPTSRNTWYVDRTRYASRIGSRSGRPFDAGVPINTIQRHVGRPIQRMAVADLASRPSRGYQQVRRGNTIAFYRPEVRHDRGRLDRASQPERGQPRVERRGPSEGVRPERGRPNVEPRDRGPRAEPRANLERRDRGPRFESRPNVDRRDSGPRYEPRANVERPDRGPRFEARPERPDRGPSRHEVASSPPHREPPQRVERQGGSDSRPRPDRSDRGSRGGGGGKRSDHGHGKKDQ